MKSEFVNRYAEQSKYRVQRLRLSCLVSCGVNLKMVVRILTRFGCERKRKKKSKHQHAWLPLSEEKETYPHLFVFQELKDDVPEILEVHFLLGPRLVRGRCCSRWSI